MHKNALVAIALTVYGIETVYWHSFWKIYQVATALTVYGIETDKPAYQEPKDAEVATALTVYGIETFDLHDIYIFYVCRCNSTYRLRY